MLEIIEIWDIILNYILKYLLQIIEERLLSIIIYKMEWMKWNSLRLNQILMILSQSIKSVLVEHTMKMKTTMENHLKNTCENNYKLIYNTFIKIRHLLENI